MIFAPKSKFDNFLYKQIFYHNFKKNFAGINVKNFENVINVISQSRQNNTPVIFCSNHSNWWDVNLVILLCLEYFKIDSYFITTGKERFNKNLNKLGAVHIDSENLKDKIESISNYLKESSKFLWIFPQNDITDINKEIRFTPIVSDLVESLKEVILLSCMIDYHYIDSKKPEIFIDFFESKNFTGISYLNKESFTMNLEQKFEYKIKEFQQKIANRDTKDFKKILTGKH
ncbi:MAG: 1-acyl-sn-glycerol-3-phosphate acyltransferase [Bacteroidetes bacterium]|nr:1-acyl-sn-glycerol-3-phosphate acyltransferase [Bacteroidota bacterium]